MKKKFEFLDEINFPSDLRKIPESKLQKVADELREEMIDAVSVTGGHLGASLGVVELTVALHYIFNTPNDKLIWDVGHQCYPHKILTGRKERIRTLRQGNGLSGFTKRLESEYDPFGAAHSSTSISSALGIAEANKLSNKSDNVIAVIGDGAISAGMAYEAMNNAGASKTKMIVILNDNDMSIARPVGAMSTYLAKIFSGKIYFSLRETIKLITSAFSKRFKDRAGKAEEFIRDIVSGGTLFNELGFYYVGPIDGHNLDHLLPILRNIKDTNQGPILLHVVTKKGKGYLPAENSNEKFHGVSKFNIATGEQQKSKSNNLSFTNIFSNALIKEAEIDKNIVAISAAMPSGTGLNNFQEKFPNRFFDVGIAEQHAVTFAAGLAIEGMNPFVAIYSTFLQRAYDQIVHDVAIQNLPVKFAIDRAGLVGADGPTHAGSFDISFLSTLPNFTIMAASDEIELARMVKTASIFNQGPISFRYPRGSGEGIAVPEKYEPLEIGKARIISEGSKIAILSLGARLGEVKKASHILETFGLSTTIVDARFAKPLDEDLIIKLSENHEVIITIEEGSSGGFGSSVLNLLSNSSKLETGLKIRTLTLPDRFIAHATPEEMYAEAELVKDKIVEKVLDTLNIKSPDLKIVDPKK